MRVVIYCGACMSRIHTFKGGVFLWFASLAEIMQFDTCLQCGKKEAILKVERWRPESEISINPGSIRS